MKTKPFLIGVFVVIAVIAAVSIYVAVTIRKVDKQVFAVASPDGRYKAVRLSLSRGGGNPFCLDSIAIFLSVYPDNFVESEKTYEVYRRPCAPPAARATLPKVEWLSNSAVQIAYWAGAAGINAGKSVMKPIDASQYVRITYVARK